MLILLSPAKQLDFSERGPALPTTRPALIARTRELAKTTSRLSARQIQALMDLSDDLAGLNRERFQAFDPDNEAGRPAALAFDGEVYRGLDAPSLSAEDLAWAQDRLRILSGLYGVLRPLDAIQPYRLEMGAKLKTRKGGDLYAFWGDDIAKALAADLDRRPARAVVNLASNEYAKAARLSALGAELIEPAFKEEKDGALRMLMVFAKKARGMMARWIIENRIEDPARILDFTLGGYRYDPGGSTPGKPLFTRPQPAGKA